MPAVSHLLPVAQAEFRASQIGQDESIARATGAATALATAFGANAAADEAQRVDINWLGAQRVGDMAAARKSARTDVGGGGHFGLRICPGLDPATPDFVGVGESVAFATAMSSGLIVNLETQRALVFAPACDAYPLQTIGLHWFPANGGLRWEWRADGGVVIAGGQLVDILPENTPDGVFPALYHGTGPYSAQVDVSGMVVEGTGANTGHLTLPVRRGNDQRLFPYATPVVDGRARNDGAGGAAVATLHLNLRVRHASGGVTGMSFTLNFVPLRTADGNT